MFNICGSFTLIGKPGLDSDSATFPLIPGIFARQQSE